MLPASEGWRRLHPATPFLKGGRFTVLGLILIVNNPEVDLESLPVVLVGLAAVLVVAVAYGWVIWRWTGYRLLDDQLEMHTGLVFRQRRRLPLARVEAVDVGQPLFARLFGLAELRVEAVSHGASEVRLQYLPLSQTRQLREELLHRRSARLQASSESEATEPPAVATPGQPPVPASESTRVIASVPSSLLILAHLAPLLILVPLAGIVLVTVAVSMGFDEALALLGASLVSVVLLLIALVRPIERLYGFTITAADGDMIIRRGLLNVTEQRVPVARIQGLRITEPLLWRLFQGASLEVDIAGYGTTPGSFDSSVLLPVGTRQAVVQVAAEVLPSLTTDMDVERPPERAQRRALFPNQYGVGMGAVHLVTKAGVLRRFTHIVPYGKVQSLRTSQGPWQRALGLATVRIDTPGRIVNAAAIHCDEAQARALVTHIRSQALPVPPVNGVIPAH